MRCATSRLLTLRCEAKRSSWLPMLGLMKRFWLLGRCAFRSAWQGKMPSVALLLVPKRSSWEAAVWSKKHLQLSQAGARTSLQATTAGAHQHQRGFLHRESQEKGHPVDIPNCNHRDLQHWPMYERELF